MQDHFVVGFVRDHEPAMRAFAVENVARGQIWWDTIVALIDSDQ